MFGDDLTERLKTVKESNKAAEQLTGHKGKRSEEHSRSSYSARGSFLFHRRGNHHQGYLRRNNNQFNHKDNRSVNNTSKGKGDKTCPPVVAGRIQHFLGKWKQLTHDPSILNTVRGYKIDFLLTPVQFTIPRTINFPAQESANYNVQISKFLEKGIIVKSSHEEGEFISNIFLRPKKDGSFRRILNLKDLNTSVCFVFIFLKWIPSILVPNS